jgi:hypothetical protein
MNFHLAEDRGNDPGGLGLIERILVESLLRELGRPEANMGRLEGVVSSK